MKISSQASLTKEVAHVSNGDDQEQELEFGTNFTVNLRKIQLTAEQRDAISNDITAAIIARIGVIPPKDIEAGSAAWSGTGGFEISLRKYGRYM
jgi:hypothetical protein